MGYLTVLIFLVMFAATGSFLTAVGYTVMIEVIIGATIAVMERIAP